MGCRQSVRERELNRLSLLSDDDAAQVPLRKWCFAERVGRTVAPERGRSEHRMELVGVLADVERVMSGACDRRYASRQCDGNAARTDSAEGGGELRNPWPVLAGDWRARTLIERVSASPWDHRGCACRRDDLKELSTCALHRALAFSRTGIAASQNDVRSASVCTTMRGTARHMVRSAIADVDDPRPSA